MSTAAGSTTPGDLRPATFLLRDNEVSTQGKNVSRPGSVREGSGATITVGHADAMICYYGDAMMICYYGDASCGGWRGVTSPWLPRSARVTGRTFLLNGGSDLVYRMGSSDPGGGEGGGGVLGLCRDLILGRRCTQH